MPALLFTGPPGVGKTTVIRRVASALSRERIRGFTTEEIREGKERVGFQLETFDGRTAVFAHVKIRSPHGVGKYRVDLETFEEIAVPLLHPGDCADVYLVDEIGKMECLSSRFVTAVKELLNARKLLVATVAARGGGLIEEVKRRAGLELWRVSRENRESLPRKALNWIETVRGSGEAPRAKR